MKKRNKFFDRFGASRGIRNTTAATCCLIACVACWVPTNAKAQNHRDDRIHDHFETRMIWRRNRPKPNRDQPLTNHMQRFHSFDGSFNNLQRTSWGVAGSRLLRLAPPAYSDGISEPARIDEVSPRLISNEMFDQRQSIPDAQGLSSMVWQWGQFIDHDLDLTETSETLEPFPILVPAGDPWFDPAGTGSQFIMLLRSAYAFNTGVDQPREQVNFITSWLDGSMVYGSDEDTANSLRHFRKGMLKVSASPFGHLLPADEDGFFLAGDIRVNEQVCLTAMHTLFMREHNRICRELLRQNPDLTDDQLYFNARERVIATIQSITYNEFLPAILGSGAIPPYSGYQPNVFPNVSNEFSTAAYRFGHSMLNSELWRMDSAGESLPSGAIRLSEAFFNPDEVREHGIDPLMMGLCLQRAQAIDNKVVDDVRNFLFGPPGAGGFDLVSLNVQRGRDHGLPDINRIRQQFGLPPHRDFMDLTSDVATQIQLHELYGDVKNVDPWVAMLCEDHFPGAAVGETAWFVIRDQFLRLRDGDRFWYENRFSPQAVQNFNNTRLSNVVRRNTGLKALPIDMFHVGN
ncbi:MAG: peroxidase family protein [Pirellulaceae bacterium]